MKKLALVLALTSITLLTSCVKNTQCPEAKIVQSSTEDPVLVVINGESITEKAFNEKLSGREKGAMMKAKAELYEAKKGALDEFVFNQLVDAEAKKKGVSSDEYLKKEIDGKIKKVSDSEVTKFYNDVKAQSEKGGRSIPALDDNVKDKIRQQLSMKSMMDRRDTLFSELMSRNKVIYALDQPRVQVEVGSLPGKGSDKAKVTIVEFSDFQCPFCKKGSDTLKDVIKKYGSKVKYHFRDFPLSFHDRGKPASNAARCAAEQGKFWEFHDSLFADQKKLADEDFIALGKKLNLDMGKFEPCVKESKRMADVEKDIQAGENAGVSGTPAYFINGVFVSGALPLKKFEEMIDEELKK